MVLVTIEAVDDTRVEEVTILLDGNSVTTFEEAPYEWSWSTAGVSAGPHILRAEATDSSGNVGGDEIRLTVMPPGVIPESEPPTVESISYDPSKGQFHIRFSKPMNRTSVEQALHIAPHLPHLMAWEDDSNMSVLLQETAQSDTTYTLAIGDAAADSEGTTLAKTFTFTFNGTGTTGDPLGSGNLWLQVSVLLAVGWVAILSLLLWSRRGLRHMRMNMRRLALQVDELNNAPPEKINVYHRY